jgi:hypothetical protein
MESYCTLGTKLTEVTSETQILFSLPVISFAHRGQGHVRKFLSRQSIVKSVDSAHNRSALGIGPLGSNRIPTPVLPPQSAARRRRARWPRSAARAARARWCPTRTRTFSSAPPAAPSTTPAATNSSTPPRSSKTAGSTSAPPL